MSSLSKFFVTSSVTSCTWADQMEELLWDRQIKATMASSFTPLYNAKSSAFKITHLIYVHCLSKEDFSVHLKGFSCAALMCKEINLSYLESMSKWRVCLLPKFIEDRSVEELFSGVSSPALIRMNSSCDITVSIFSLGFSPSVCWRSHMHHELVARHGPVLFHPVFWES